MYYIYLTMARPTNWEFFKANLSLVDPNDNGRNITASQLDVRCAWVHIPRNQRMNSKGQQKLKAGKVHWERIPERQEGLCVSYQWGPLSGLTYTEKSQCGYDVDQTIINQ